MILAGDIGGTKTLLGLFSCDAGRLTLLKDHAFPSGDYPDFSDVLAAFLESEDPALHSACFGVAGPVLGSRCQMTNLSWTLDAGQIAQRFKIAQVSLINDLEATAYGTLGLPEDALITLNPGHEVFGANKAVIAAGTGLGEAVLFGRGGEYTPSPSEAGNADFAPRNNIEIALLQYLLKKHLRVSIEQVLSGPGLIHLYQFFQARKASKTPQWLAERFEAEDCARVISEAALAEEDDTCIKALDLFVSIYGAEAGNLALRSLPFAGLYIGGGIAPKILKKLQGGDFMKAFLAKGPAETWLKRIPVHIVLESKTALYGAAAYAAEKRISPQKLA